MPDGAVQKDITFKFGSDAGTGGSPSVPDWYNSLPDAAPSASAAPAAATPTASNNNSAPSWYNSMPDAPAPKLQAAAAPTSTTPPPQNRSWPDRLEHSAGIAATGVGKGAAALTPLGMVINAPTMGFNAGASILGTPLAYGVNKMMGVPNAWDSAKADAMQSMQDFSSRVPTTNSMIDKIAPGLPKPENKPEQYLDTASQFAGGAQRLGQSVPKMLLAAGAGAASEGAGQATKGTIYEMPARIAAGGLPFVGAEAMGPGGKTSFENPMKPGTQASISNRTAEPIVNRVQEAASYPDQLQSTLDQSLGQNGRELVPGVTPTLGEVAGDQGLAQAQNAIKQRYPQPFQAKEQARQTGMAQSLQAATETGDPDNIGAFVTSQLNKADLLGNAKELNLANTANEKISALGRYGEAPEEGATGDTILDARNVRNQQTSDMYKVLDSVNDSPADHVTLRNAANDILENSQRAGQRPMGSSVDGLVKNILDPSIERRDDVEELRGYLSQTKELQRDQGVSPTDRARLQQLNSAGNKALENTVNGLALQNEEFYQKLLDEKEKFLGQEGLGQNTAAGLSGNDQAAGTVFSGSPGAEAQEAGQPAGLKGNKSVPGAAAQTPFGQRQLEQYKSANTAYRQNKMLDELENSGVIDKEGNIVSDKFDRWNTKIQNRKNVANSGDFGTKLLDAKDAQAKLDAYRAQRSEAVQQFNKSQLSKFVGENADPVKVVGKIFNDKTANTAKEFGDLVSKLKGDPNAVDGLKAAVAKHINDNVAKASITKDVMNKDVGRVSRADAMQQFFFKNKPALEKIYSPDEIKNLENVAMEIRRNQEYERMANIKGQSNTAKNLAQNAGEAKKSMYGWLMHGAGQAAGWAALAGEHFGGIKGAVAGYGAGKLAGFLDKARTAGIEKQNMFELQMYNNPEFARAMLQKFNGEKPNNILMSKSIQAAAKLIPAVTANKMEQEQRR